MKSRKVGEALAAAIVADYRGGKGAAKIARERWLAPGTVLKTLAAAGVEMRPRYQRGPAYLAAQAERRQKVAQMTGEGFSVTRIAAALRVTSQTVRNDLRALSPQ